MIQLIARLPSQFCERVWVPERSRSPGPALALRSPEDAGRWLSSPNCPAGPRATEEQTASPCPWSRHTRGFCQDCDGALRCPQEPFATPSPRDFLVCRAFLSGDAAGLRRAACTATEALRGAHSSWFYGRRVYRVSHVEPSSRPCAEPRSVAVSGAVSPWPTRLAVPGRGFPRLPRETCSSLRRLRPSFPCCGDTGLAVWVTMGLLWYFVVVVF